MPNRIVPRRSFAPNAVPVPATDISQAGELVINWSDKIAYSKDASGNLITVPLGTWSRGSGSSSLVYAATPAGFPATGSADNLYISTDTQRVYRWDSTNSVYVELGPVGGGGDGGSYTLPVASATVLGGIKIGTGLSIDGNGVVSAQDTALRALLVPPAPTGLTVTRGNAQGSLTWTAPSVLAQTPITDYVVQYKTVAASTWNTFADGVSTATSTTVTGLTNDVAHVARVAAVNGAGTGAFATSSQFTPTGTPTDPNYANVVLLSHFDGADRTRVTPSYAPFFLTTDAIRFGTSSLRSLGNLQQPMRPEVTITASGNLVVECWLRLASAGTYSYPNPNGGSENLIRESSAYGTAGTVGDRNTGPWTKHGFVIWSDEYVSKFGNNNGLEVRIRPDGIDAGRSWQEQNSNYASTIFGSADFQWAENLWYYIAWVRSGGYWSFYVNGNKLTNTLNNQDTTSYNTKFSYTGYNSFIDDLRVTVGTDRGYTGATIEVPTGPFPDQ